MVAQVQTPVHSPATPRVRRLRQAALTRHAAWSWQPELHGGEAWMESRGDLWWIRRKGQKTRAILRQAEPVIDPEELLVGKTTHREPTPREAERLERVRQFMGAQPPVTGQTGHMGIDHAELLALGCRGLQEKLRARQQELDPANPDQQQQRVFYEAACLALEGVCDLAARYAQHACDLAAEEPGRRRKSELLEIAAMCERVPAGPALTFRDALQASHFINFCIQYAEPVGLLCPGRMDRWLWPYYQRDVAAGRLTPAQAQELIDCYFILINEIIPRGLAIGAMVGGQDAQGQDVTNEVSFMCLQAVENTRLAYPGLGICWHEGTPDALLDFGCQLMAHGRANPAIFNDQVIPEGLRRAGVRPEESHLYINSTCVEISPLGSSNVWVASPYFNLTGCLLDVVDGLLTPVPSPSGEALRRGGNGKGPTFAQIKAGIKRRLADQIAAAVAEQNAARESRERFGGTPLLSCFVNDCLARGRDIDHGGARHNWIECSFVGLANLVDSLMVIREFVYDKKSITLGALRETLASDFAGAEDLRQCFLNYPEKYGNDRDEVDALAREFTEFVAREAGRHRVRLSDRYYAGFFCWIMHQQLGAITGASPDGRRAGFAFADGAGPAQGRERHGPTAAVKSVTKWDHTPMLGGLVLNLKFSPKSLREAQSRANLLALIKTYMRLGGQEVQVNCVSRDTLLAARERPEEHRDLLVRIAGYVDYFVGLPEGMQEEVILRTEFDVV